MKSAIKYCLGIALMASLAPAHAGGTVVLREDFNGAQLDSTVWGVGTWKLGRTQLGNVPVVAGGIAQLAFNTYRFTGSEIYTRRNFSLGNGVEFEARVRMNHLPSGLVTSLFTYNTQNTLSDELDIEFLSKQVNLSTTGAPMLMTTWNNWDEAHPTYGDGIHHSSQSKVITGLDVNLFHTYTIRWLPGRTEWLVDGVLVASSTLAQPDLAAPLRINFWAPASSWTEAYDSRLRPVGSKRQNQTWFYDVDWVEVRQLP
ncbi:MAG: glycoside hydrolase family 16 protein [Arenimonas sp.]|nr:glycoside hydrolase family 16 protein [Arenimonas sp.]